MFEKKNIIFILVLSLFLTACSADSFIEIENKEEQYKEVEKQLNDLKDIKVKLIDSKRIEEMKDIVFKYYFRRPEDTEHQKTEVFDGVHSIDYESEDISQLLEWNRKSVYYIGNLFGEDYIYKTTDEQVIQKETELLFERLGLPYNDKKNGYVIDKKLVQGDNSVDVHIKKCIEGKDVSLATSTEDQIPEVELLRVTFGNNQIISIYFTGMTETVEVKDYKDDVQVDSPEKAYKLLSDFMATSYGTEKIAMDTFRVSYVESEAENGIISLCPMVEFYDKEQEYIGNIQQINLFTKEVRTAMWASPLIIENSGE